MFTSLFRLEPLPVITGCISIGLQNKSTKIWQKNVEVHTVLYFTKLTTQNRHILVAWFPHM